MNAYTPTALEFIVSYVALVLIVTTAAYLNTRRSVAWLLVIATAVAVIVLSFDQPAGVRMVTVIFPTLTALKAVVMAYSPRVHLRFDRWLTFMWAWPGMRPELFWSNSYRRLPGWWQLVAKGFGFFALGLTTFMGGRALLGAGFDNYGSKLVALIGISLMLHFGFLNVLTGLLRFLGINVMPLFDSPLASRSLREFWGKRWNIAFTEMTNRIVFLPLAGRVGVKAALVLAFAFSGLLHELAISVPAQAGFGLPLIYFLIQGTGILVERFWQKRGHRMNAVTGHVWVTAMLVLPMPLVFHTAFFDGVVRPFI